MFTSFFNLCINLLELKAHLLMHNQRASFRRKPESSVLKMFWTPPFTGVTTRIR